MERQYISYIIIHHQKRFLCHNFLYIIYALFFKANILFHQQFFTQTLLTFLKKLFFFVQKRDLLFGGFYRPSNKKNFF